MRIINSKSKGFERTLKKVLERGTKASADVEEVVRGVLDAVRRGGDRAVAEFTQRFDNVRLTRGAQVPARALAQGTKNIPARDLEALELAAIRIRDFHTTQLRSSSFTAERGGSLLGQKVTPLRRVGIYVPGGKALYPSTVLMNAVPARVAGVEEVVMATPPTRGPISPYILAAARIAGVDRVFRMGGAQAIAALAYGTETVPRVDKIVGPGNIYVATAKRLVFGAVDIDMIAGPSEILIINDGSGEPSWIAADLLSQAEHDELASSILITTSRTMAGAVSRELERQLKSLKPGRIAAASLASYGLIIIVGDLPEAVKISDRIAPEHLELFVERPLELLGSVRNAGAIFLGASSPEAIGDYMAGPNHTLPTGGTARFSSPLGVEDFIKRSSVIGFSLKDLERLGPSAERLARIEGLKAHARSLRIRLDSIKGKKKKRSKR